MPADAPQQIAALGDERIRGAGQIIKTVSVERVMMQSVAGTGGEGVMKSVRGAIPGALVLGGAIGKLHPEQARDEIMKAARIGRAQIDMLEPAHTFAIQRRRRNVFRSEE